MSTKLRIAMFSITAVLTLIATSCTIPFVSVSAQYSSDQQSGGTSDGGTAFGTKVSIVEGASTMADKAYDPNPSNVKVGDTVTWTNDDSQPHTVTSGTGSSDPDVAKIFDSSPGLKTLLVPKQTFSHKFDTAGEFSYFCQVHPTMVGKVVVN